MYNAHRVRSAHLNSTPEELFFLGQTIEGLRCFWLRNGAVVHAGEDAVSADDYATGPDLDDADERRQWMADVKARECRGHVEVDDPRCPFDNEQMAMFDEAMGVMHESAVQRWSMALGLMEQILNQA